MSSADGSTGASTPSRKRKFAFSTPPKEQRETHAWVSAAGQGTNFFVEFTTNEIQHQGAVMEALGKVCTRGTVKASLKNDHVISVLTGSDKMTAQYHQACVSTMGKCPIKREDLNHFANGPVHRKPVMDVCVQDGYVKITGTLYMLVNYLVDSEGLNAECLNLDSAYQIKIEDDFSSEEIVEALKNLCNLWGWKCSVK